MSDRAMGAMEAVVRVQQPTALWVDALCVPVDEPARSMCLRWMGAIYGRASRAVVVLSERCAAALEQIRPHGNIDEAALLALDEDDWVTRAWTYQELVNANAVRFITEGGSDACADGDDILNFVGSAVAKYGETHGLDVFDIRTLFPRLDSLESLLLDWKMQGYMERSAYQVMASMHGREALRLEDHFHAMVGAISPSPIEVPSGSSGHPADHFMRVCEAKDDYSFVYTTGPKSQVPGRRWQPLTADRFHVVLPWHSYGAGQSARVHADCIELDNMWCLEPAVVGEEAEQFAVKWLRLGHADHTGGDVPTRLLRRLRLAGFSGVGEQLELEAGYFFAHSPIPRADTLFVAVATGVHMIHGAPGLLLGRRASGIHEVLGVGMFIGRVPEGGEAVAVG